MDSQQAYKAAKINEALFDISQSVNFAETLFEAYQAIHQSLRKILQVDNFYIALYDAETRHVTFPYYIDEKEPFCQDGVRSYIDKPVSYSIELTRGSMTGMVIKQGKALIITREDLYAYCREEQCEPSGVPPEIWMGAPLRLKGKILGVMAVQSYNDPRAFDEDDAKVLSSVCDQVAVAIERKLYQTSLQESEARYRNLVENIREVLYSTDESGAIIFTNSGEKTLLGIEPETITGTGGWYRFVDRQDQQIPKSRLFESIIHPIHKTAVRDRLENARKGHGVFQSEYKIAIGANKYRWVLEKGRFIQCQSGKCRLEGLILDIHNRKRAELINQTLYEISNAVNTTFDLDHLYSSIYQSLNRVIDVRNFFIAIYDKTKDSLSFPFDIDEKGNDEIAEIQNVSESTALTGEVIRKAEPLMMTKQQAEALVKQYGDDFIGDPPELWLGVPLMVRQEVIGAMVTQSYSDPELYDEKDIETFLSVSGQVATAIDRKRYEEELIRKELELGTLFSISNAINTTFNTEELYRSIHKALQRIIDVRNFGIALYDKETDAIHYPYLVDIHQAYDEAVVIEDASHSWSLAYEVVAKGSPLMMGREEIDAFLKRRGGSVIGYPSQSWLGIPLKGQSGILGAIVIQNYEESNRFKNKEIELLTSISDQIAFAIERKQAESELAATQRELIDYAHKVGMADIANATLHNVGNILNSVKTSTDQIRRLNDHSDVENLRKANQLLCEKISHLENDQQDAQTLSKLTEYYSRLEEQFNRVQNDIQAQVERLNNKINLMTEVITTQQNFTSPSFMTGDYHLEEILEDALTMQSDMLNRYRIKLIKRFEKVPQIQVQRTKLVHILLNLLINAKDAMLNTPPDRRKIEILLKQVEHTIQIRICDSGEGISPENLTRIFSHGFTTKKTGHDFGLHNSALYLEEMHGQIEAASDGAGKGAAFTVSLPITKKTRNRPPQPPHSGEK